MSSIDRRDFLKLGLAAMATAAVGVGMSRIPLPMAAAGAGLKPAPAGHTPISRQELVERVIADALPVRFQLQLHKVVWPPHQRGV